MATMEIMKSTSTELVVNLSPTIRFCGQRHSNRMTGCSVWETWFEQYGKWKVHDNPFDRKDYRVVEKWGKLQASIYKGVKLAKTWDYKKDIIEALNQVND